jgi:hypothetical protein
VINFSSGNLRSSSSGDVIGALGAVTLKRDSVICESSYSYMIMPVDYMRVFRSFTEMSGRDDNVVLPKLS